MNISAQRQEPIAPNLDAAPAPQEADLAPAVPSIEPRMAQVLELAQKNNATLTPREINDHLARILQSYDELTALYARNSAQIEAELGQLRQAGGTVSEQLHQVTEELDRQANAVDSLATTTSADIESVQTALVNGLSSLEGRTDTRFANVNLHIHEEVTRLDSGLQSLQALLTTQERIIAEQTQRMDQFDATYALLDTATRGNRARIETVREEAERKHAVITAQVQGLASLQREYYKEFSEVRSVVALLQSKTQRLDSAVRGVASDLEQHTQRTRKTFQWTYAAIAAAVLLTAGGIAAVKWAPAFAPQSTQQALAQSAQDVAALQTEVTRLTPLEARAEAQASQMTQLARSIDALRTGLGEVKQSVGALSAKVDHATVQALAATLQGLPLQDSHWVQQQDPKAFTVQLIGVNSPEELSAFVRQNGAQLADAPLSYTVTLPAGQYRYNLFYGVFANAEQARAAIDALPAPVLSQKPWVRQMNAVQNAAR